METTPDDQRLRDLECDRRFSAALCMSASAILAARLAPHIPTFAALLEPNTGIRILSPIVWFGTTTFALLALYAAFDAGGHAGGLAVLAAAALVAVGVPFAWHTLRAFVAGAPIAWAAGTVALVTFGLAAGIAVEGTTPSSRHAKVSAGMTVLALLMAATDRSGVFSAILAVLGILFFARYRAPAKG